jgi:hypothetical protein
MQCFNSQTRTAASKSAFVRVRLPGAASSSSPFCSLVALRQRPRVFRRVFDLVKVGFKEPPPRPVGPSGELKQPYFLFDTRQKGNGNQGHSYSVQLSDEEKDKLLEYLKTL